MTGKVDQTAADALRDEAVEWLLRVQSDAATAEDWAALTDWLEASEDHLRAFEDAEALDVGLGEMKRELAGTLGEPADNVTPFTPRPRRREVSWFAPAAIAASLAVLVAGPMIWRSYQGAPVTYRTGVGETQEVTLADGTHIHMDSGSALTVRLGWRTRRVQMAQAEAAFDVAKDPNRPFVIKVGDQQVRVVGTAFNIRHFDNSVVVTVSRGIVQVSQPQLGGEPVARLVAGDELRHVEGSPQSVKSRVDPAIAYAWTQGRLVCQDEALSKIVSDLNRRYQMPIRVSEAVGARKFTGVLELGDETEVVRRLSAYLSLSVHRTGGEIVLE